MKRLRIGGVLVGLVAALALATNVYATTPQAVTFTVETRLENHDPFASTGGLICATGEVSTMDRRVTGWQNESHAQILLVKQFECADGTFDVLLRVTVDFASCDTVGTWSVLGGTGAFERLRGAGMLNGDSDCVEVIVDTYVGSVHVD